jgi:signal transduction histidine kinase
LELKYPAVIPAIQARRDYRVEYRIRRADGEYRWMLETATPRFLADGEFAGYIGVMIDITDLKRNQEQLSATQKLESLGLVVSGVSHNFNNLLATILAEADLALMELSPESAAHDSVTRISGVAIRASEIVALLMAYGGAGGKGALTPVNLSTAVEETIRLFRATVAKQADVSVNLAGNLSFIRADISQIRQLVLNLLTNAWEALGDQEGSIRVTTSTLAVSPEDSSGNHAELTPGKYARLEVADSGCGISDEGRARIFDPFYTTKFLGRGLGLAAVQGIVRTLGGVIYVRSTPGQGSTFEVLLPCCDDAAFI